MNYKIVIALGFVTVVNTAFTLWWSDDTLEQRDNAEQFLSEVLQCTDTGLVTAGANEYAKVFDCRIK
jgi:hypothetical protein